MKGLSTTIGVKVDEIHLPVSSVPPLVILHVALGAEAQPAAVRARVWPFVPMDSGVRFQILPLTECPPTPDHGASEWLSATMHVHMRLHSDLTSEALGAARKLAREALLYLLLLHTHLLGKLLVLYDIILIFVRLFHRRIAIFSMVTRHCRCALAQDYHLACECIWGRLAQIALLGGLELDLGPLLLSRLHGELPPGS